VALLWMVHPLQTETVAYTVQRTELMMALFYLLTLWCAWRGFHSDAPRRRRGWLVASVIACGLGMGSKEVMVSAPLCVLLMDRALVAGSFEQALRGRSRFYGALAATWIILFALNITGPRSASAGFSIGLSPWHYLLTQSQVIVHYLRLVIWPHPLLIAYYWPICRTIGQVWPQGLMVLVLFGLTCWALWRRPVIGWLGATCFMILAPTSSIVPIATEIVAERRMYLVLAPLFVLGLAAVWRHRSLRRWWPVVLGIAIVWAGYSFVRVDEFNNPRALWANVLRHYPKQKNALSNIGLIHMNRGELEIARGYLERVAQLYPELFNPAVNYGVVLMKLGEDAAAEREFRRAINVDPNRPETYYNLGRMMAKRGDDEDAAAMFENAIRCQPESYGSWYELGSARHRLHQFDEAIIAYRQALKIRPYSAKLRNDLGVVLAQSGRTDQAVRQFQAALAIDPAFEEARQNLERAGQRDE
jgi:Flp pilus assembly protein TadD